MEHRLIEVLPAENYCGRRASLIKAHPHNVELYNESYEDNGESRLRLSANTLHANHKFKLCKKEYILFRRFLIIVRDPYQSIWAEYQRSHTPKGYHNTGILLNEFNQLKWDESEAIELAKDYEIHWNRLYGRIFRGLLYYKIR